MAKIGFLANAYNGKADGDEENEEKAKKTSLIHDLLEQTFSPTGKRDDLVLLTTEDLRYFFRHMVYSSLSEMDRELKALRYRTVLVGNTLCWRLYYKKQPSGDDGSQTE